MIPIMDSLEAAIAFYAQNPGKPCVCRSGWGELGFGGNSRVASKRCNSLAEAESFFKVLLRYEGSLALPIVLTVAEVALLYEIWPDVECICRAANMERRCKSLAEAKEFLEGMAAISQDLTQRIHDSYAATLPLESFRQFRDKFNEAIASDTVIPFKMLPPEVYNQTAGRSHPNGPGVANVLVELVPAVRPLCMWQDPNRTIWLNSR